MEKQIKFSELSQYNDSNSVVWMGLLMRDEDIKPMNEWFHEIAFIGKNKNLVDWKKITGNILGDEGRSDILLIFDNEESQFSPVVRLQIGNEIKWTSDFITNYQHDYIY